MLLLETENIKKHYADRLIIELDDFKIYTGDRIGVVGLNGSGKTTLLDMLSGRLEPDEGYVRQYCEIGYIRRFSDEGSRVQRTDSDSETDEDQETGRDNVLLFADEPTTNLDFKGIELLSQKLNRLDSFVLISHDRSLLDTLCNKIAEVRDGKARVFNGNFSFYKQLCEQEQERSALEYEKYVDARAGLEAAISSRQHRAKTMKKAPARMGNSEARLHKREANERQQKINNAANSLMTRLEKLETKEKPREVPGIKLDFSLTNPPENKVAISAEKLNFSYDHVNILTNAGFKVYNGIKTALWGQNGTGKTTLLNLISADSHECIHIIPRARLLIQGEAVHKNVGVLSGEERIKTAFAKMFVSGANVQLQAGF